MSMGPIPDEWYEGFAAAVALVARHGDHSLARVIMTSAGVTVKKLKDNGVDKYDLDAIKLAMDRRRRQAKP